jgi:hypothetical protein
MKGFFWGLTAGLTAGVVTQMMIAKNHEQMLELVRSIPRPLKFGPSSSIEELLAQKNALEELINKKQAEAESGSEGSEGEDYDEENDF